MTVKKPIPKQLLQPNVTAANMTMNRSEFPEVSSNLLKARDHSVALQLPHYFKLFYGMQCSFINTYTLA